MLMYSPRYEGFYGSIERVGKASVQTLFHQPLDAWPALGHLQRLCTMDPAARGPCDPDRAIQSRLARIDRRG